MIMVQTMLIVIIDYGFIMMNVRNGRKLNLKVFLLSIEVLVKVCLAYIK